MNHFEWLVLTLLITVCPVLAMVISYLLVKHGLRPLMQRVFGKFPLMLAGRYLFSLQHRAAINFITLISVVGVTMVTYFLLIILSIFNGFQHFIENRYTAFDPDLKVVAARGKSFVASDSILKILQTNPEVAHVSPAIEDRAMITYFDKQYMASIKGLRQDYLQVNALDTLLYEGKYEFQTENGMPAAVLGGTVAYYLNSRISDRMHPMKIWAAGDARDFMRNPEAAVRVRDLFANAYFRVQMEYDGKYVLVDYAFAEDLFDLKGKVSSYDIKLKQFDHYESAANQLQASLGSAYRVESWYDMHATLFNVMKNEKFVAYLILTLMLLIAAVNIIGGLSMVIVDKTRDIGVMGAMGASLQQIRRIFLAEGMLIGLVGGLAGIICAACFSYLHIRFGVLKLNGGDSFQDMQYFPMRVEILDYFLTLGTVVGVSMLAGIYPSRKAAKQEIVVSLRK
jgi:lipoprotein-releasing system permease protein